MKRIWLVLLAGTLAAWNASAQSPTSKASDGSQETKPSSEQSGKKESQTKASGSASASTSTSASAQAGQNSASLSAGTTFEAALSSSLDAKKNKEGDQVVARTTQAVKSDGQVVIPKGSKLIGHVTQAKARAKGESESALGIVFDQAVLKNGQQVPIHVAIQALAAAQTQTAAALDAGNQTSQAGATGSAAGSGRAAGSGGALGGVGSTVGAAAGAVTNTAGAVGSTAGGAVGATTSTAASATTGAAGQLTSSSSGVIGLKGLSLSSEAASATQGSLIVSSTKNVHLDSGTRMLLRVTAQ